MAQTKRKRRTKHRGTAAGSIQSRGRTGRRPTAEERKKDARTQSREKRLNTPPTWMSSFKRAILAAGLMFAFILVTNKKSKDPILAALVFGFLALAIYVPAGYYLETFLYRRRQRRRTAGK